jgi:hypothetical protein
MFIDTKGLKNLEAPEERNPFSQEAHCAPLELRGSFSPRELETFDRSAVER